MCHYPWNREISKGGGILSSLLGLNELSEKYQWKLRMPQWVTSITPGNLGKCEERQETKVHLGREDRI